MAQSKFIDKMCIRDRSCFVNLDRVQGLEGSLLVLANGEKLPISRPMLPKVKEAIISLWGKGR